MSTMAYESPTIGTSEFCENKAAPAFFAAAAAFLGVSAGYVAWVCSQCVNMECNSFWNTVNAVRAWWGDGC